MKMVLEMEKLEEENLISPSLNQKDEAFGGLFVKVMTDEQLELLRYQISVYATICEQLAELHKSFTSQQHHLSGMKLGSLHYDPLMAYGGHKITSRQRWSPTPSQLQVLERIFDEGNGTPSKQKIKDITTELAQHGQISETNVYNWFQNRRARSKRKQSSTTPNNTEPEADSETHDYLKDDAKPEDGDFYENSAEPSHDRVYFPSPEELMSWPENGSVIELQHGLQTWSGFGVGDRFDLALDEH